MPEQFDSKYFAGNGPLFIAARQASGEPAGLIFVGDIGEANLTPNVETSEVKENVSGKRVIASSIMKSLEYSISLTMRSIKPDHLAQAIQGSNSAITSGSVTNQAHKGYHGKFIRLTHVKVSTVVVTNTAGDTTYTANTDYVLKADEGLIEILSTGTITDGQDLHIDYAYAAQHHIKANPQNTDYYLVFSGINLADNNKQTRCELYKVKLDPGVLGLISEEQSEMTITGRILIDTLRGTGDQLYSWKTED